MKMKKNDKAYLQDLKIDIRTNSDINYQELALLFDKQEYMDMLPKLRKMYGVINLNPAEDYSDVLDTFIEEYGFIPGPGTGMDLSKYKKLKELKESFEDFYDAVHEKTEYPVILEYECYLLCYEFNRPPHFAQAIQETIFCGAVTEDTFEPTKAKIIERNALWFGATLPPIAIFVSPTSTYEDVKEEFRKAKGIMKTDKRLSYYQPRVDLAPNIRKYREWYWERIKGKTYQQISDEWIKKHENETTTYLDVLKAVKTYEKLLAS